MTTSFGADLEPLTEIIATTNQTSGMGFRVLCRVCKPACINPDKGPAGLLSAEDAMKLRQDHIQHHIMSLAGELGRLYET